ncbi:MAG: hypothetical protein OK454_03965, partial [Thaumarchaeota archaeon]|nr:hypothetical protein [Nitrososphaerota archaeon]
MILKQNEQLTALKSALGKVGAAHAILLEKFFHALMPMEVRTSSETEPLKQLFLLLLSATKIESRLPFAGSDFLFKQEAHKVLAILPGLDGEKKKNLLRTIEALHIPPHQFATFSLDVNDIPYTGFILLS